MTKKQPSEPFKVGDRVKIRYSEWRGRIVEERGPLAPGGVLVYRVRIPQKPKPKYIELREDQLILIPTPPKVGPSAAMTNARSELQMPKTRAKKERGGQ